jgi:hypothetical protein
MPWADGGTLPRPLTTIEDTLNDQFIPFAFAGPLIVVTGTSRCRFPMAATIIGVSAACGTAPTGASVKVDVHKNGTTIYTTQGNRPDIAVSTNAASETTPDVTAMAAGDYLTVDVDQVGSTIAGADLTVFVRYRNGS